MDWRFGYVPKFILFDPVSNLKLQIWNDERKPSYPILRRKSGSWEVGSKYWRVVSDLKRFVKLDPQTDCWVCWVWGGEWAERSETMRVFFFARCFRSDALPYYLLLPRLGRAGRCRVRPPIGGRRVIVWFVSCPMKPILEPNIFISYLLFNDFLFTIQWTF